jgi:molecular chaperone DnaK
MTSADNSTLRGRPRPIGIDLGTTNSVVAYLDASGTPTSLDNFSGRVTTPSKVLFLDERQALVGVEAVKASVENSQNFAEHFKRHMGDDAFSQTIAGRRLRPEELSAVVLKSLLQDARRRLTRVGPAVITVPAYFDECRRRATYDAAAIAGWEVLDLINEPTAAALAYANLLGKRPADHDQREHVLVFDLGGGTLDATVLQIDRGREYRTIATDGEVRLGGHDWDLRLRDYLADLFRKQTGFDPLGTLAGQTYFLQSAEQAKRLLSDKETAQVVCTLGGRNALLKVDRKTFEGMTQDLVARTQTMAQLVLDQAGCTWSDIQAVLAVGGATRMPMIRRMLEELSGRPADQTLSQDEAVAHGAAIYAHLKGDASGPRVINVNSHSYRVLTKRSDGSEFAKALIPKNSPLPARNTSTFQAPLRAPSAKVEVYEGEDEDAEFCMRIGKVVVDGLPPASDKRWWVQVALLCREDGNLEVAAAVRDPADTTKIVRHVQATLEPAHGMTRDEVAAARQWLESVKVGTPADAISGRD